MIETTLSLTVPLDRQLRDDIKRKTECFLLLNKSIPPVSYSKLAKLADMLLVRHNWDHIYKAFVMVCCGNAIWRPFVGSIPYNRRMLLLPQCLRNSLLCKAREDELGLLCSDCGNCNISGFLREAEDLGYITIVAEGTTIATRLVESGKIDAIIGVGCMEVLQKMVTAVNKYSLPAIGIPLLKCGCIDTIADAESISEEIHNLSQNSDFRLLNLNNLRDKTKSLFSVENIINLLSLSESATDKLVLETLLAGGKRIRPLLTVLTYEVFSNQPDTSVLQHLALSVECFHKASLIHDDIEDNDSSRYGKETIHTRYGIPVAINLGDLLIGEGYRLIAECNLPPHVVSDCLKIVSQGHKALSIGQGTELMARINNNILSLKDILTVFENKTAAAFKVSLLLGAIAGDADEKTLTILDNFSYHIGLAYQIKDDLEDFGVERGYSSIETPSVLLAMLVEKIKEEDKNSLHEVLLQNNEVILNMFMEKYKIRESVNSLLKEFLQKTNSCLGDIQNIRLRLVLHEIMGKTFSNYL
jgi:geranylgeranyl diphosphate synthase type II